MTRYNPADIEPKWQKKWADGRRYVAPDVSDKPKYYVTGMFPYPSGAGMHTGHFFEHAIVDAVARFRRALGYNVMYPMGWDSFGLPAENYAIKTGKPPAETTVTNIDNFKNQLRRVGSSIDWNREVNTADPEYYQWTQWVFTKLFERGLAYQKEANQWWCPVDKTVLANEQVVNGRCWRCDSLVVKKPMKQWFFKITDYADALLDEIPDLDWPEKIKLAQTNWIGKSKGAEVEFAIAQGESRVMRHESRDSLKFTPELTQMIVDGKKTSTIHLEPKNLQVGDWAEFMTRDGEEVTHFGYAKITKIRTLALRDIPNDLPGHEPMLNDEQKLAKYKGYYDDTVTLNTNFTIYNFEFDHDSCLMTRDSIKVFTTRPDTLFGATFLVLAPEHPLVKQLTTEEQRSDVEAYVSEAIKRSEIERMSEGKEKTGIFTGGYAINPLTNEKIPVWVADYVLWGYGTGAIMAVPAHDERDYAFAKKFDIPVKQVIMPCERDPVNPPRDEYEEVVRDTVIVHLRDTSTGKYALLDWHGSLEGTTTAIMGGIEKGQSPEEAALMEISEEAALKNVRILKRVPWVTAAKYCASHKKQNRKATSHVLLAEVDGLSDQGSIPENEQKLHTLLWVDETEVSSRLTPVHHKQVWDLLQHDNVCLTGEGELINSGPFDSLSSAEARELIIQHLEREGKGREKVTYRMRDWLISRQRYWGAPIPIVHCPEHGAVAVPENELPVVLPDVKDFAPRGDGKSVLAAQTEWVTTSCPACGGPAMRETDTMDGYACSSWYLLRYTDPHNSEQAWSPEKAAYWSPLDMYIGGDHAVAHLLYVRFWSHVFYDMKLVPTKEPVKKLVYHGLIQAEDGTKMSKSKGNTIDPLEVIDAGYGADALRTFELFLGPINENSNWSSRGIGGVYRFLNRFWTLTQEYIASSKDTTGDSKELLNVTHAAIKKVTDDALQLDFNTAISTLMECVNKLYKLKLDGFTPEWQFVIESLVKLLQPFAPHMSAELWEQLGHDTPLDTEPWPQYDEKYLVKDTVTVVLQVNGKVRATIDVPAAATKEELEHLALENNRVREFVAGKKPTRVVVVPGRLVNVVV